jgi:alpha-beta hydrolase superfamily lysophospholipase
MARRCLWLLPLLMLTGCESLFFFPSRQLQHTPAELSLQYQDVFFAAADGTQLHGWFLPAQGAVKGTVLHLHGNAANIGDHVWAVRWLPAAGYQVLTFDYRGYGRSQGEPSLAGAQQDIDAALGFLLQRSDVAPKQVVVLAQSLGGAMGHFIIWRTAPGANQVRLLVVDSAFSSYQGIAREKNGGLMADLARAMAAVFCC